MIVSDIMTRKVLTVSPDDTVENAAKLMLRHGISGLFVVDAKAALAGVLTEGDLLRRDEIGTQRHRPWWLRVLVSPGQQALDFTRAHGKRVSDVWGTITNPDERRAICVVVENVAGVKTVHDHLVYVEPYSGTVIEAPDDHP